MKLSTALGWTAGAAALGVTAWAIWFGAHFSDSGQPRDPLLGHEGETWWLVYSGTLMARHDPTAFGTVLESRFGTAQDGGEGNTVYIVRLGRNVMFHEGGTVLSARKLPSWP
jgi:hypothetical protein